MTNVWTNVWLCMDAQSMMIYPLTKMIECNLGVRQKKGQSCKSSYKTNVFTGICPLVSLMMYYGIVSLVKCFFEY